MCVSPVCAVGRENTLTTNSNRLEHLVSKGYLDSVEDKLTLQFAVRSPTFYHDSLQQSKHVTCLTRQIDSLQERLRELEQSDISQEVAILCRSSQDLSREGARVTNELVPRLRLGVCH